MERMTGTPADGPPLDAAVIRPETMNVFGRTTAEKLHGVSLPCASLAIKAIR
jgi:hypothetical protein